MKKDMLKKQVESSLMGQGTETLNTTCSVLLLVVNTTCLRKSLAFSVFIVFYFHLLSISDIEFLGKVLAKVNVNVLGWYFCSKGKEFCSVGMDQRKQKIAWP